VLTRQQMQQRRESNRIEEIAKTHLEYAQPTNAPRRSCSRSRTRRLRRLLRSTEDVPIEVRREVERAFPRLEPALVRAGDDVRGRIDKRGSPLVGFVQGAELEARVEEVSSREYYVVAVGSGECQRRVRERFGERGELRCRSDDF
jgi:hypothetical protein